MCIAALTHCSNGCGRRSAGEVSRALSHEAAKPSGSIRSQVQMTMDPRTPSVDASAESAAPDHLTSGQVAAYLTGALQAGDRSRIEAHLSECEACCTELIE